ncbi:zinc ribbon domain-containing protein [Enterocloster bolteae]|uniref:zinc ribbon domain-containing protein n=1 Tax=Enterocloster bolteae TaxID=208479 RepID=UPI0028DC145B|nr:zinc ribbon domain-containing protein [Enterocloster bolteae]
MNKRNIDIIYKEAMHCGIFSLIWLPAMAGIWLWKGRKRPAILMIFVQIVLQIKAISKMFLNYRPERKCPVCEAIIPEGSNFCPSCGYILRKDLWGPDEAGEFNESEEGKEWFHDSNADYRRIEEEVIKGIA